MNLPGWIGVVAMMSGCATPTPARAYVFHAEYTWSRATMPSQQDDALPEQEYMALSPSEDRWRVTFHAAGSTALPLHGDEVTLEPLAGGKRLHGKATPNTGDSSIRTYSLDQGAFAGGVLWVEGSRATLTLFGSGVPVVSSERGPLRPE